MAIEGKRQSIPLTEGPSRAAARSYLRGSASQKTICTSPSSASPTPGPRSAPATSICARSPKREGRHSRSRRHAHGVQHHHHLRRHHHGHAGHEGFARLAAKSSPTPSNSSPAATLFDGLVGIAGCDKNMPGTIMALCRLDIPGMMLYGGSIAPGKLERHRHHHPERLRRHRLARRRKDQRRRPRSARSQCLPRRRSLRRPVHRQHHGHGGRDSSASRPCSSPAFPPLTHDKHAATREAGRMVMDAVRANRRPSQIITRKSLENAIASVAATGGSTNAVLHLIAIAHELGIDLTMDDFDAHQQAHALHLRPLARRQIHRHALIRTPAARAFWQSACSMRASPTDQRSPSAAGRSPKKPLSPTRRPARSSSTPLTSPSSPPAASSSSKAISRPKAA